MATKDKKSGAAGFFESKPEAEEKQRTTIMLTLDDLDLVAALKSHYRREGETVSQSELCARGLRLLAENNGVKA